MTAQEFITQAVLNYYEGWFGGESLHVGTRRGWKIANVLFRPR